MGGRKSPFSITLASGLYNSLYYRTSRDNAFSSLHGLNMFRAVADTAPFRTLIQPIIISQDGDPSGPLLFCNTTRPLLASLTDCSLQIGVHG